MAQPVSSPSPDAAPWSHRRPGRLLAALGTVALFAVAGPVAGYLVVVVALSLAFAPDASALFYAIAGALAVSPVGVPFAFALAWSPALLTGLAMAGIDALGDSGEYRVPIAILLGALMTILLLGRTVWGDPGLASSGVLHWLGAAGATGGIAAAVCAGLPPRRVRGSRAPT